MYNKAKRIIYTGLFIEKNSFYNLFPAKLAKEIEYPHVTVFFKPKGSEVHQELFGEKATITVTGYGCDEKNEGFSVKINAQNPELQKLCDGILVPHITISVSEDGKPVDTGKLEFETREQVSIEATFGAFTTGGLILR
ncbi:MAG: hypothetical protein MJ154_01995 [Candidatus Saccharibacteria bacterium]|nr:hypothetical protein [Candidatus Saccharibacteria bacterium]